MSNKEIRFGMVIILILMINIITFVIIPELTPPAELKISLQSNHFSRGQQIFLFYKVTNLKTIPIENVIVTNFIIEKENPTKEIIPLERIEARQSYSDKYKIDVGFLDSVNRYTIKTVLNYTYKDKEYIEELTLGFDLF